MDFLFRLIITVAPIENEIFSVTGAEVNMFLYTLWDRVDECSQSSRSATILGLRKFNWTFFRAYFGQHFTSDPRDFRTEEIQLNFFPAKNAVGAPQGPGSITLFYSFELSSFSLSLSLTTQSWASPPSSLSSALLIIFSSSESTVCLSGTKGLCDRSVWITIIRHCGGS